MLAWLENELFWLYMIISLNLVFYSEGKVVQACKIIPNLQIKQSQKFSLSMLMMNSPCRVIFGWVSPHVSPCSCEPRQRASSPPPASSWPHPQPSSAPLPAADVPHPQNWHIFCQVCCPPGWVRPSAPHHPHLQAAEEKSKVNLSKSMQNVFQNGKKIFRCIFVTSQIRSWIFLY